MMVMITIGCAGFPVPATRYFKEFLFVEVQDTHVTIPGTGTIRRWRREAPPGFRFSMLGPKDIGQEGFREGTVTDTALNNLSEVGGELQAVIALFVAPADFVANKVNKAAVKDFLVGVKQRFEHIVWEAPASWPIEEAEALVADTGAVVSRDPLRHGTTKGAFAYYRMGGPAGRKSRYEDPAIEKLAELAGKAKNKDAIYVFTNVDMFADAKRLKKALKL